MAKKIEIPLIPSDFIGNRYVNNTDCPLARAAKRYFDQPYVSCCSETLSIRDKVTGITQKFYTIKDGFSDQDYDFVKEQYEKDPKMKKVQYVVTLIQN